MRFSVRALPESSSKASAAVLSASRPSVPLFTCALTAESGILERALPGTSPVAYLADARGSRLFQWKGPAMSILDQLLGQASQADFQAIAAKVGLSPEQAQSATSALLPKVADPNVSNDDAVQTAAAETGLPPSKLQELLPTLAEHLPGQAGQVVAQALSGSGLGAGMLGQIGGMLDKDGDGNPVNDILGMFRR